MKVIRCRAQVHRECRNIIPVTEVFESLDKYYSDRTYDQGTGSIVCDTCFVVLGCPRLDHLEVATAIRKGRVD